MRNFCFLCCAKTIDIMSHWSNLALRLVLTYEQLEDRRINNIVNVCFCSFRFHVAVRLFSRRSQKTSKCAKNISDTHGFHLMYLFYCSYNILMPSVINWLLETWNLWRELRWTQKKINLKLMHLIPGFVTISELCTKSSMIQILWHIHGTIFHDDKDNSYRTITACMRYIQKR